MNAELTIIRELLENFLGMSTPNTLSEITRIRLLMEQLVVGGGGPFLPITGIMGSGNPYIFGLQNINSPNDFFGFQSQNSFLGFIDLGGVYMSQLQTDGSISALGISEYGKISLLAQNITLGKEAVIIFTEKTFGIRKTVVNGTNIFEIDFDDEAIGFFNNTPAPQQTISNTNYILLAPPEKSLADALIAYGLLSITP